MQESNIKLDLTKWHTLLSVLCILIGFIALNSLLTIHIVKNYTFKVQSPVIIQTPLIIDRIRVDNSVLDDVQESTSSTEVEEEEVEPSPEISVLYEGKVSYYSHSGCLGCSDNQIMGNGQPFNENELTLAVPCEDIISGKYKYNTPVTVVNNDNYLASDALITDCGGFSKYDRIADLSLGLYNKLEAKTDISNIVIYKK